MFRFTRTLPVLLMLTLVGNASLLQAEEKYKGIGRTATAAEIKAWDIDVRPDFAGLPPGSGSVAQGQQVWDAKCASCHGTFGESNEVFSPLVGGTTADDIKTGRVKALQDPVARSTLMKVSTISTLWDYINRAMPWNAPKSLSTDEVYASLAYLLYLGDIVPANFVLTEKTMPDVQARLPNRNGKVKYDGLWNIRGKGDVQNVACMKDCKIEIGVASALPEAARGTHGNLAEQQRVIGPSRVLERAIASAPTDAARVPVAKAGVATKAVVVSSPELARKSNCMACHQVEKKLVGPAFVDIAAKYKADGAAESRLVEKVKKGGAGVWGPIPMPPSGLSDEDIRALVKWVLAGAPGK